MRVIYDEPANDRGAGMMSHFVTASAINNKIEALMSQLSQYVKPSGPYNDKIKTILHNALAETNDELAAENAAFILHFKELIQELGRAYGYGTTHSSPYDKYIENIHPLTQAVLVVLEEVEFAYKTSQCYGFPKLKAAYENLRKLKGGE